jgi:hypothetical protein
VECRTFLFLVESVSRRTSGEQWHLALGAGLLVSRHDQLAARFQRCFGGLQTSKLNLTEYRTTLTWSISSSRKSPMASGTRKAPVRGPFSTLQRT